MAELRSQQWQDHYDSCVRDYGSLLKRLEAAIQASSKNAVLKELDALIAALPKMNSGFLCAYDVLSTVKRTKQLAFVQYRTALKLLKPIVDNFVLPQFLNSEQRDLIKRKKVVANQVFDSVQSKQHPNAMPVRNQQYKCASAPPFVDSEAVMSMKQKAMRHEAKRRQAIHPRCKEKQGSRQHASRPPTLSNRRNGVDMNARQQKGQIAFDSRTHVRAGYSQRHQYQLDSNRQRVREPTKPLHGHRNTAIHSHSDRQSRHELGHLKIPKPDSMRPPARIPKNKITVNGALPTRPIKKKNVKGNPLREKQKNVSSIIDLTLRDHDDMPPTARRKGILKHLSVLECNGRFRRKRARAKYVTFPERNIERIKEFYRDSPVSSQRNAKVESAVAKVESAVVIRIPAKTEIKSNNSPPPAKKPKTITDDVAKALALEYSKLYTKQEDGKSVDAKSEMFESEMFDIPTKYSSMWNQVAFCRSGNNVIQPVLVLDPTVSCHAHVRKDWQRMMERGQGPLWQVCFIIGHKSNKNNKGIVYRATADLVPYHEGAAMGALQHPSVRKVEKMLMKLQGPSESHSGLVRK